MSEANGSGAANANSNADGGANGGQGNSGGASNDQNQTVPKAELDRALADMHKYKSSAKAFEDKLADLESKLNDKQRADAEQRQDFKGLYEETLRQKSELENKYKTLNQSVVFNEKHKAVTSALVKAGLKPEGMKILDKEDLSDVEVEITSKGNFIVHGADTFVNKWKTDYPFFFGGKEAPTVNSGTGTGGAQFDTGEITPAQLVALEAEVKAGKKPKTELDAQYKKYMEQRAKKKA